jgi:hypothetical protein
MKGHWLSQRLGQGLEVTRDDCFEDVSVYWRVSEVSFGGFFRRFQRFLSEVSDISEVSIGGFGGTQVT